MAQQTYNTALYMRLSVEDEKQGDSSSIRTQRQILRQYAEEHGMRVYDEYVDDGFSGVNFDNRPSFQRLKADIEDSKINCVLVKDLSRLGRNYSEVGYYTDRFFPNYGVRLVAINGDYDSNNESNRFAGITNVMNDWYAEDISAKVRKALDVRYKSGDRFSAYPLFGYKKDPEHCGKLLIDEDTSWIVRKIFDYALAGHGAKTINKMLTDERIPCPAWYLYDKYGKSPELFEGQPEERKYQWTLSTVEKILRDESYIGNTIHHKQGKPNHKAKYVRNLPKDKWLRIENTQEPIISKSDFAEVQELIKKRRRPGRDGEYQIFSGLLFCGDCGRAMPLKQPCYQGRYTYRFFACSTYNSYGPAKCSQHRIDYDALYQFVLSRLQFQTRMLAEDEDMLLQYLLDSENSDSENSHKRLSAEKAKCEKRLKAIEELIAKLYEDRLSGKLDSYNADMLLDRYQQEQATLRDKCRDISSKLQQATSSTEDKLRWIAALKKYMEPKELTREMLNSLIEKICVYEPSVENGEITQRVQIHYKFIGVLE